MIENTLNEYISIIWRILPISIVSNKRIVQILIKITVVKIGFSKN